MPRKCLFTETCIDFPKSDGLIPGAGEDHISFWIEVDIGNVMIMPVEGLEAHIIVVNIPKFDGEIG
jgi:hypothetical protein